MRVRVCCLKYDSVSILGTWYCSGSVQVGFVLFGGPMPYMRSKAEESPCALFVCTCPISSAVSSFDKNNTIQTTIYDTNNNIIRVFRVALVRKIDSVRRSLPSIGVCFGLKTSMMTKKKYVAILLAYCKLRP